jgi:(R,R)-butanediol dehydrogenase/meso-butanediol dehydrogenase/diacetyl reductase
MRAAVFREVGMPLSIETLPDPTPGEGEVVVKVARCGICGTDLHMTEGHGVQLPAGTVLGHEFSGEIVAVGKNVSTLKVGQNVAAMPIFGCRECEACKSGRPALCSQMQFRFGGYAEYAVVNAVTAARLPNMVSLSDGALAEPLAVGLHGVSAAQFSPGADVVVLGAGPIGLATLFWARRLGARRVYVIEKVPERRDIAYAMGASEVFEPIVPSSGDDFARFQVAVPVPELADVVFECVGRPGLLMQSTAYAKRGGKIVSLGYCFTEDPVVPAAVGMKELQLLFPQLYTSREFELGLDVLGSGAVEPRHMITDTVGFDRLPETFESLRRSPRQCKVLIDPLS